MLLHRLLESSDAVEINKGHLVISPASNRDITEDWISKNSEELMKEIAKITGVTALQYHSYSTGLYNGYEGVTLQFINILTGENPYAVFNADLKRIRNTAAGKAGGSLPKGHFRVGKRSKFYQFWIRANLAVPKRMSSWHDYMGNLKQLVFSGEIDSIDRLSKDTVSPLNISYELILSSVNTHNMQTTHSQGPHIKRTIYPDKKSPETRAITGDQPLTTAGPHNHGYKVIRENGIKDSLPTNLKSPQEQTTEEWLAEYASVPDDYFL